MRELNNNQHISKILTTCIRTTCTRKSACLSAHFKCRIFANLLQEREHNKTTKNFRERRWWGEDDTKHLFLKAKERHWQLQRKPF